MVFAVATLAGARDLRQCWQAQQVQNTNLWFLQLPLLAGARDLRSETLLGTQGFLMTLIMNVIVRSYDSSFAQIFDQSIDINPQFW